MIALDFPEGAASATGMSKSSTGKCDGVIDNEFQPAQQI
jgi:hypothetical protein